jgi:hypothetical protein
MRYNTKRHEAEIGNTMMDYITFGEGEKTLVLIPGLSFKTVRKFAEAFSFMYRIFGKDYTVYAFDRKRQLPIGYTIKNMADDLAQVGLRNYMSRLYDDDWDHKYLHVGF